MTEACTLNSLINIPRDLDSTDLVSLKARYSNNTTTKQNMNIWLASFQLLYRNRNVLYVASWYVYYSVESPLWF